MHTCIVIPLPSPAAFSDTLPPRVADPFFLTTPPTHVQTSVNGHSSAFLITAAPCLVLSRPEGSIPYLTLDSYCLPGPASVMFHGFAVGQAGASFRLSITLPGGNRGSEFPQACRLAGMECGHHCRVLATRPSLLPTLGGNCSSAKLPVRPN